MTEELPRDRTERIRQRARIRKNMVAEAKKLYEEGNTSIEIAQILGIKPENVDTYLGE